MTASSLNRLLLFAFIFSALTASAANWPAWRGPENNGVSREASFPTTWNKTTNVVWQTKLPNGGNSTPIVWGDKVFVSCALKEPGSPKSKGAQRAVMCFNRKDGKQIWQKEVQYSGNETTHDTNPYCSSTPITDGERVYVWQGSAGIVAYDMDGNEVWHRKDLGEFSHIWGNASTPLLEGDNLIAYCGPGLNVFVGAFDKKTGKDVWRIDLPEAKAKTPDQFYGSWSSPVIREADGKRELILGLPTQVVSYDLGTQKQNWTCKGLGPLVYTNPLVSGDTIVVMSGYGGPAIGLKAGGSGDITETNRLWQSKGGNPQRVGSGIIVGDHVFILNDPGFAQCIEVKTGKEIWHTDKLGVTPWSSMCFAGGKLYVIDFKGETFVIEPATEFRLVSRNPLGEMTRASLAFSDGQIFIRTYENLYCIGAKQ